MAECLIVADRKPPTGSPQATFVMLAQQSPDPLVGAQLATTITDAIVKGVEVLENGPHGATSIRIGDSHYGHAFNGNLPTSGPWWLAGICGPNAGTDRPPNGHWPPLDRRRGRPPPSNRSCPRTRWPWAGIDRDINGINKRRRIRSEAPLIRCPAVPPGTAYPYPLEP